MLKPDRSCAHSEEVGERCEPGNLSSVFGVQRRRNTGHEGMRRVESGRQRREVRRGIQNK